MSINNKILRLTTGLLNTINDSVCGGAASGTGAAQYTGQLGQYEWIGGSNLRYDSSVGTVGAGCFQYVKLKATSTATPARGLLVFWDDPSTFTVIPDGDAKGRFAGVLLNAVTKGNYGIIQVAGLAYGQIKNGITKSPGEANDALVVSSDGNTLDNLADATAVTWGTNRTWVANASGIIVTNTICPVYLNWKYPVIAN